MTRRNAIIWILGVIIFTITGGVCSLFIYRRRSLNDPSVYTGLISEVAEVIIPSTQTPGAKDANISISIVQMIKSCLSERERRKVITGLEYIQIYTQKKYSSSFNQCLAEKKIAILDYFDNKDRFQNEFLNRVKQKVFGPSFFELIKDLTVKAYCSSRIGGTQGLAYDHIPVEYVACMPMGLNQRSWATS